MNERLSQYKLHLLLILVLASIKFVILPVSEWQMSSLEEITSKKQRLLKIEQLKSEEESFREQKDALNAHMEKMQAGIPQTSDLSIFMLDKQRYFEKMLNKNNIKITDIGWGEPIKLDSSSVNLLVMDLRLKGKNADLINALYNFEAFGNGVIIDTLNSRVKWQSSSELGTADAYVKINVFAVETGS